MGQYYVAKNQWLNESNLEEQKITKSLRQEQRLLAIERQELERQKRLFETKWKILEEEYIRLAKEKEEFQQQVETHRIRERERTCTGKIIHGEMFFSGVDSELGMRKRYKDLIKIFHPDNRDGDTSTLQVINKEYDKMKKLFCV